MDLPAWGQGKSKRRRAPAEAADAEALPDSGVSSLDAVNRGMVQVGKPLFNNVYLVVGGLIFVAAAIAGVQYLRGQGKSDVAASTRVLAKGLAPLARGQVIPEGQDMPKGATVPVARSEEELLEEAQSSLDAAAAGEGQASLVAELGRASLAMRRGKAKEAATSYATFLAAAGDDHPLLAAAREGHALALEESGDLKGALEALNALASQDSPRVQWHLGRIHAALGQKEQAKQALEKAVKQKGPRPSNEARMAKSLLATLSKAPSKPE